MKLISPTDDTYLDEMVSCQIALAKETESLVLDIDIVAAGIHEVIQNPARGKYHLALNQENQLIGMLLTISEWSDWRCAEVLWIHSVYILPEHRKQQVFKSLYNHVKSIVDSRNSYAGIRLYVDKTNLKAVDVYKKIGMSDEHYTLFEYLKD